MKRILIADDHAVVRQGIKAFIQQHGYEVVAEASTGEDAYVAWKSSKPDLMLVDLDMHGMGGLETLSRVMAQDRETKILVFTMHEDTEHAARVMRAGAMGYVVKSDAPETLLLAIRQILEGKPFISHTIATQVAIKKTAGLENPLNCLTKREFEVFKRLIGGRPLREIATQLNISYPSAANIQTQIRQKLQVSNTQQLIDLAIKHHILP